MSSGTAPLAPNAAVRWIVFACAAYAIIGGISSFLGWVLDIQRLTDWNNSGISIQPNATICVTLSGLSLLLTWNGFRKGSAVCGGAVALIGGLTLFEWISGINLGFDSLLMFGREWGRVGVVVPGRMGPPGSLSWTLIGTALLLLAFSAKPPKAVPALALITLALSFLSITSYLYGASVLYTMPRLTVVAFQTATYVAAVSIALIASAPDRQPLRLLLDDSAAGLVARRVIPIVIILPLTLGWIRLRGQEAGLFDAAFGTTARTLIEIVCLVGLLWWGLSIIKRHEKFQKDAEEALSRRAQQVETLLNAAPVGIYLVDREFRILQVNPIALPVFGEIPGGVLGREFDQVMHHLWEKNYADELVRVFRRTLETGEAHTAAERAEYRTDRGKTEYYEGRVDRITLPDGHFGLVCYFRDISAQVKARTEVEAARATAENASRAKDKFLAMLSHELRTPLTPVLMTVAAMDMNPGLPSELRSNVAMIRRNIELEAKLIDDLLDLSRVISGKLQLNVEPLDISSAVRHACETCEPFILEKGIRLHCKIPDSGLVVKADAARIQQVLWNLVRNAAKFTPEQGEIRVTASPTETKRVRIEVCDTGIGIAPDVLPKIFDAFEQGDANITRQFGGMGLGLAISKAIVEMHGGTISVESKGLKCGSTFSVELPALLPEDGALQLVEKPLGRVNGSPVKHLRILLVEDHADTADVLARVLRDCGFAVTVAHSAASAIEIAGTEQFDVLVSDLGLPDATGYELMKELKMRHSIKGIAMSGYGMEEDLLKSSEAGFSDHIVKPANFEQLERSILRLAGRGA